MTDGQAQNAQPQTNAPRSKLFRSAAIVTAIVLLMLGLLWAGGVLSGRGAERKLAAIEAARAIPDEENAAVIYTKLATTLDVPVTKRTFADLFKSTGGYPVYTRPWPSSRYPQLAEFIDNQQDVLSTLKRASMKEKCRFSIVLEPDSSRGLARALWSMRLWQNLLVVAANNDIAEGRLREAVEKYLCLIRMAGHLYQQPTSVSFRRGFALEGLALRNLNRLIVQGRISAEHLAQIEKVLSSTKAIPRKDWVGVLKVEQLYREYQLERVSLWERFRTGITWPKLSRGVPTYVVNFQMLRIIYYRLSSLRYGSKILLALRRCKELNGSWPDSLQNIEEFASEALFFEPMKNNNFLYKINGKTLGFYSDPVNIDNFVYKVNARNFTLYSKGRNKKDENGKGPSSLFPIRMYLGPEDDVVIWPATQLNPQELSMIYGGAIDY